MRQGAQDRHGDAAPSRRLVLISLITSLTLVGMVLVLAWGRANHNDAAASYEASSLVAAATHELSAQTRDLATLADQLAAGAPIRPDHLRTFDRIFAVDATDNRASDVGSGFDTPALYADFSSQIAPLVAAARDAAGAGLRGPMDGANPAKTVLGSPNDGLFIVTGQGAYAASLVEMPPDLAKRTALTEGQPVLIGLKRVSADFLARVSQLAGITTLKVVDQPNPGESLIAVPLNANGQGAFVEWRADRPGDRYVGQIGSFLVSFAALFAGLLAYQTTLRLADSEVLAKRLAGQDLLSGLANRYRLSQEIETEIKRCHDVGTGMALLCIDLDRFKEVNDTFGHDAGDRLIVHVASRLRETIRAEDTAARLGGDEFSIIQTNVVSREDSAALAARLLSIVAEPIDIGGNFVSVGMSIGIALYPQDTDNRETLFRDADLALYKAKHDGRNRFCFFHPQLSEDLQIGKSTEEDLRRAIANDELTVYYQPIVSGDGKRMVAVEALVRWHHPDRGMILPDHFISLAESRGLIVPLGEWVLRRACRDALQWPNIRVAVNVSAIQFRARNFVQQVDRVLRETGVLPTQLELELTESVVVEDVEQTEAAMFELRARGLRLALDDFGTSYSSLIYLRRFAFDKIKIDKSFLASLENTGENAIIVHSVVHLGRALGLTVTAEGVETFEQHRFLQAVGAHELQGFLFSKPLTASEITSLYANGCQMPPPRPEAAEEEQEDFVVLRGAA
jgi:diguanylate cyclase (GGDEF)-like protein